MVLLVLLTPSISEMKKVSYALVICVVAIGVIGCATFPQRVSTQEKVDSTKIPDTNVVQLRYATLPSPLSHVAIHYWFAVFTSDDKKWSRWEVWQNPDQVPASWGHVHKNLMHPDSGVGGGAYKIEKEWRGKRARNIINVLNKPNEYLYRNQYHAWPGPNSNTYVAWVLKQARIPVDLNPKAIGKDFLGPIGAGLSSTLTGVQVDSPILGLKAGLKDGIEIHLLCTTIGLDFWYPAFKTPFGRLGIPESSSAKKAK
jgi:hypothetical protein